MEESSREKDVDSEDEQKMQDKENNDEPKHNSKMNFKMHTQITLSL